MRGAWIEMPLRRLVRPLRGGSLPMRGAWIEIAGRWRALLAAGCRSPCGERGLKCV